MNVRDSNVFRPTFFKQIQIKQSFSSAGHPVQPPAAESIQDRLVTDQALGISTAKHADDESLSKFTPQVLGAAGRLAARGAAVRETTAKWRKRLPGATAEVSGRRADTEGDQY